MEGGMDPAILGFLGCCAVALVVVALAVLFGGFRR